MISIIIPILPNSKYKEHILKEIKNKIKSEYEIIILDSETQGVNSKWNEGVEKSKGEYIFIINDDLVLTEGIDLELLGELEKGYKVASPYTTRGKYKFELPLIAKKNNIVGWCFMMKRSEWIPIPDELDIWYGDDWIFNKVCDKDFKKIALAGLIHHFESKSLNIPEKRKEIQKRINRDKLQWDILLDNM